MIRKQSDYHRRESCVEIKITPPMEDYIVFGKKKAEPAPVVEEKKEKPTPAYLRDDYPYKAIGEPITDLDSLEPTGVLYEIKCPKCEMSIRSQGCNIKSTYERLMNENGCIGCGNKELVVKKVDSSKMEKV